MLQVVVVLYLCECSLSWPLCRPPLPRTGSLSDQESGLAVVCVGGGEQLRSDRERDVTGGVWAFLALPFSGYVHSIVDKKGMHSSFFVKFSSSMKGKLRGFTQIESYALELLLAESLE